LNYGPWPVTSLSANLRTCLKSLSVTCSKKRLVLVYRPVARHNQHITLSNSLTGKLKVGLPTLTRVTIDLFTSVTTLTDWTRQERKTIQRNYTSPLYTVPKNHKIFIPRGPYVPEDSSLQYQVRDNHHHHNHHMSVMELGHLLTRYGLTYLEVSSEVCHDSFYQLGNSVSLSWVVCCEAFCLHVVSSSSGTGCTQPREVN
jgi:hypothetical protein